MDDWVRTSFFFSRAILLMPFSLGTASMASRIHKRPKSPLFLCSSSSLVNSPSPPSHINKRCAKRLLLTCDSRCILFPLPELATARGYMRISMRVWFSLVLLKFSINASTYFRRSSGDRVYTPWGTALHIHVSTS